MQQGFCQSSVVRIIGVDNHMHRDTIHFGKHVLATRCLDNDLGEVTLPPWGPNFDIRFGNPTEGTCPSGPYSYGLGIRLDLRPWNANIDTFRIIWNLNEATDTFKLYWSGVTECWDSVSMRYGTFGQVINMKTTDSVVIIPGGSSYLSIYARNICPRPEWVPLLDYYGIILLIVLITLTSWWLLKKKRKVRIQQ
jgi:hypothetical protein